MICFRHRFQVGSKLKELAEAMVIAADSLLANHRFFHPTKQSLNWKQIFGFCSHNDHHLKSSLLREEFTLKDPGQPSWDRCHSID